MNFVSALYFSGAIPNLVERHTVAQPSQYFGEFPRLLTILERMRRWNKSADPSSNRAQGRGTFRGHQSAPKAAAVPGLGPAMRRLTNLFSRSNHVGAPNEAIKAVTSQPQMFNNTPQHHGQE